MSEKSKGKGDGKEIKGAKSKQRNKAALAALSRLLMYTSLRVEDLDPKILEARLQEMNKEIGELKLKCKNLMQENDWYRNEIESCEADTDEYTKYLEGKLLEKQGSIEHIMSQCQAQLQAYNDKKRIKEQEHDTNIALLQGSIHELDRKVEIRQSEITTLSDTLTKKAKHEAEIARLQKEIQDMELVHQEKVAEVERELLKERMKLKLQSDEKVVLLESQAHKNALNYLQDYTEKVKVDNARLELELKKRLQVTQEQEQRIKLLTMQNEQLKRERRVREDLINLRLKKIYNAQQDRQLMEKSSNLILCQTRIKQTKDAVSKLVSQEEERLKLWGNGHKTQAATLSYKALETCNVINGGAKVANVTLKDVKWAKDDSHFDYGASITP